jgi:hypothetical protein
MPQWLIIVAQVFEAGMLVCFGFAWPIDIMRTLRTCRVEGKSVTFMGLILLGYMAGLTAKVLRAGVAGRWPEWVTALYALNACMVTIDIALVLRCRRGGIKRTKP